MKCEWEECTLDTIMTFKNGKARPPQTGQFPVYGGNGVLSSANQYNSENCIVIGRVGVYCGSVYFEKGKCWISDNAICGIPKGKNDAEYLYYLLCSLKLNKRRIGTSQPLLTQEILRKIGVIIPPENQQKKISRVLRCLDDEIELNNAINNNLERQAQALFKSWFIDFEPFGGTMPNDWKYTTLGEVTTNLRSKITLPNTPVFSAINTGCLQLSDEHFTKQVYSKDKSKYILVNPGNFAYNPARINIGSIGLNEFDFAGCVSPVYVAFSVKEEYQAFFRFYFKTSTFKENCKSRSSGSVRQSLNYSEFSLIYICYPSIEWAKRFNDIWHSYFLKINQNDEENKKLMGIRDVLLSRLMSGELDVSDINI